MKEIIPRFSVLRRIALFSSKGHESPEKDVAQTPTSPRHSFRASLRLRRPSLKQDVPVEEESMDSRRGSTECTSHTRTAVESPRVPKNRISRPCVAFQQPLLDASYQSAPNTCPASPSGYNASSSLAPPYISYREHRLDAMCRLPPARTVSRSLENVISIKERMAMFEAAAAKSTAPLKSLSDRYRPVASTTYKFRPPRPDRHSPSSAPFEPIIVDTIEEPVYAGEPETRSMPECYDDNSSTISGMSSQG
jgi:hypothetical protein